MATDKPQKALRYVCPRCGLDAPEPIVTPKGGCTNLGACAKRFKQTAKRMQRFTPTVPT